MPQGCHSCLHERTLYVHANVEWPWEAMPLARSAAGARKPARPALPKAGTIARELQEWKRHGYPAAVALSCNKTAWYTEEHISQTARAVRTRPNAISGDGTLRRSLVVLDDFSVLPPVNSNVYLFQQVASGAGLRFEALGTSYYESE